MKYILYLLVLCSLNSCLDESPETLANRAVASITNDERGSNVHHQFFVTDNQTEAKQLMLQGWAKYAEFKPYQVFYRLEQ